MGIAIPRPPMRKRESRAIFAKLSQHAALSRKYQEAGYSRAEASALALREMEQSRLKKQQ